MQAKTSRTWFLILGLAGVCLLWSGPFGSKKAVACPNCKSLMTSKKDGDAANQNATAKTVQDPQDLDRMGQAFNISIMLMMPLPFLLLAGLGGMLYWHMRKNNLLDNPQPPKSTSA